MRNSFKFQILSLALVCAFTSSYSQEKLEVGGAIVIKNSEDPTPAIGTIRFNPNTNHFEGWNGRWQLLSSSSEPSGSGSVVDIDGNQYLIVVIGTQTWMRENLRASHYNDGSPIPEKTINMEWDESTPAWSWHRNNAVNDEAYGKLYNWYVIDPLSNGNKNVCPSGWHVPTDPDLAELIEKLGGPSVAGGKMKEAGVEHWMAPNTGATNESGFTGLPGGLRNEVGSFAQFNRTGFWWTSTESSSINAWYFALDSNIEDLNRLNTHKGQGFSIRCIKD